jgi:pyruvate kinase
MKTKVICTIGPASWSEEMLEKLMKSGMSIARFNLSHAWTAEIIESTRKQMESVKKIRAKLGVKCEIALDTKGPDVRIGTFREPSVDVVAGQTFKFYFGKQNENHIGDINGVYVAYEKLLHIVKVGSQLCLNDGHVIMDVTDISNNIITAKVLAGGVLKNRKSLASPGVDLQLPFISPEDETDFRMGISVGVDWIFASAVMRAQDVKELREFWAKNGGKKVKIMSKIEDRLGLKNLDKIIEASDAIMVARGGLGTDIGLDKLPSVQKMIISKTVKAGKISVCATEMLESMAEKPNATRAEACDVANAVWDGAHYVMLSGETAAGKYPTQCVEFMLRVAADAEKNKQYFRA